MAKAKWTVGNPSVSTAADGTVTAVVPVLDNGTLYTALRFVLTPDPRTLTVVSEEAPNVPSLNLRAWSNK